MDLCRVDETWMHKRLAHEELDIILSVVEVIADLFVLVVEIPDFGGTVARGRHEIVVIGCPVHVMD